MTNNNNNIDNNNNNNNNNHNTHVVLWFLHLARRAEETAFNFSMPWCDGHLAGREVSSAEARARKYRALAEKERSS